MATLGGTADLRVVAKTTVDDYVTHEKLRLLCIDNGWQQLRTAVGCDGHGLTNGLKRRQTVKG